MTWVLLANTTGMKLTDVPFKGPAETVQALLSGSVQVSMTNVNVSLPHIRNGNLRALAVSTAARDRTIPETPTLNEAGVPGFDVSSWFGVVAPAGTPRAIVDRISAETLKTLQNPPVATALGKVGFDTYPLGARDFEAFYRAEMAKWAGVVKASGFKLDQ